MCQESGTSCSPGTTGSAQVPEVTSLLLWSHTRHKVAPCRLQGFESPTGVWVLQKFQSLWDEGREPQPHPGLFAALRAGPAVACGTFLWNGMSCASGVPPKACLEHSWAEPSAGASTCGTRGWPVLCPGCCVLPFLSTSRQVGSLFLPAPLCTSRGRGRSSTAHTPGAWGQCPAWAHRALTAATSCRWAG